MSIRTVVTRGFGAGASIGAVVRRGFFPEAGVSTDTTDHADGGYEWEGIRRAIDQTRGLRRNDDRRKREAETRLTGLIEAAYNRALGIEPEIADELAAAAVEAEQTTPRRIEEIDQPLVRYDWGALARDLAGLEELLNRVEARRVDDHQRALIAAALAAEEDDIEMLLMMVA